MRQTEQLAIMLESVSRMAEIEALQNEINRRKEQIQPVEMRALDAEFKALIAKAQSMGYTLEINSGEEWKPEENCVITTMITHED